MAIDKKRYYFDYNATTPLDPAVSEHMSSVLQSTFGNPSSVHAEGRAARDVVERARFDVAELLDCEPSEVVFVSGASEANNHALWGILNGLPPGAVFVTSAVEHPSLLGAARALEAAGYRWIKVPVNNVGQLDLECYREALEFRPTLVSVMMANNETGTVFPIAKLARMAQKVGALFHSDAVQATGRIPLSVRAFAVDLLSISSHKVYGPKGCGALYVRAGLKLSPLIAGGHQERGRRAGTEATWTLAGFGAACRQVIHNGVVKEAARMSELADFLWSGISKNIPDVVRLGDPESRLPNTLSVHFVGCDAESLLFNLDLSGVAASSGSACTSGSIEPSHVLLAMGLTDSQAREVVRFSLGRFSDSDDVDYMLTILPGLVRRTRTSVQTTWNSLENDA